MMGPLKEVALGSLKDWSEIYYGFSRMFMN